MLKPCIWKKAWEDCEYFSCVFHKRQNSMSCNKPIMFPVWCQTIGMQPWINHGLAFKKFAIEWGNSEVSRKVQYNIHDKIWVRTQKEKKLTHHWKVKWKWHLSHIDRRMSTSSIHEQEMEWNSRSREKKVKRQCVKTKDMTKSVETLIDLSIVHVDYEVARN